MTKFIITVKGEEIDHTDALWQAKIAANTIILGGIGTPENTKIHKVKYVITVAGKEISHAGNIEHAQTIVSGIINGRLGTAENTKIKKAKAKRCTCGHKKSNHGGKKNTTTCFGSPPEEDRGRLIFCPCKRYTAQGSPPKLPMTPTDLLSKVVRRLATACAYGSGQQSFVNELLAGTARENIQYLGDVFFASYGRLRISRRSFASLRARLRSVGFTVEIDPQTHLVTLDFPELDDLK
jgi:hypothetical protein